MLNRILLLAVFSLCSTPLLAQPVSLNTDGRKAVSLDGPWHIIIDPYENGYYDYRWMPMSNGFFKNEKPRNKWDRVEYDFEKSDTLHVPGDWNSQKKELFLYEGTVWYQRSFDFHPKAQTRTFIRFGAANYWAIVWLNGQKVGEHTGGFTPFAFEVTKFLKEGSNDVVVKVDNKRCRECVPTLNTDWWNYGGLTRSVALIETPETFIQEYSVQLKKGSEIAGWVRLNGPKLQQEITVEIEGTQTLHRRVETDQNGFASFTVPARVTLWSPSSPLLHDVRIAAETDNVRERIGFRSVDVAGSEIRLNGKPVFLRGISIHEEAPFRSGRACTAEDARTLLGWAKELGCNFVRLAHYPHNEYVTRLADSMGIMVWSEIPVYWTIQWENKGTYQLAEQQLNEMIARDRNRASIVLWSVANETPVSAQRMAFLTGLISAGRRADSTRLFTAAMESHREGGRTQIIDDPLGQFVDVLGCNEYIGWYDGLPEKADSIEWKSKYEKPLIISEFGGSALQGYHADSLTIWSEEYQQHLYKHQVAMLDRIPNLRGMSPWILMDFRSPRRQLPGIQDFRNRKGLVSDQGKKKAAYYVLQQYYRDRAMERKK